MRLRCYSLYDRKTLAYFPPYYAATDGAAVRTFSDAVGDVNSQIGRHPNDYVLFYVGEFDDTNGAMLAASPLAHVIDGSALVAALQSEIPFPDRATGRGNGVEPPLQKHA